MTAPATFAGEQRADIKVQFTEPRNRLTVAFRLILVIPHAIIVGLWSYAVLFAAVGQWFVVLFTGKRNRGIWEFCNNWLGYAGRVYTYEFLLHDEWPPIGEDRINSTPTRYTFQGSEDANRLTNALRIIWAIPAMIIWYLVALAIFFVAIASGFAIVFTGRHPKGMWDFLHRGTRYYLQFMSYTLLMTDAYPSWSAAEAPTPPVTTDSRTLPGSPLPPPG